LGQQGPPGSEQPAGDDECNLTDVKPHAGNPRAFFSRISLMDIHQFAHRAICRARKGFDQLCCKCEGLQERANTLLKISEEHSFPWTRATANLLLGWIRAASGAFQTGLAQMERGLAEKEARASRSARTRGATADKSSGTGFIDPYLVWLPELEMDLV
jgi:hypothetical protein